MFLCRKLMSMVKDAIITNVTSKFRIIIMSSVVGQFTMSPIVVQLGELNMIEFNFAQELL